MRTPSNCTVCDAPLRVRYECPNQTRVGHGYQPALRMQIYKPAGTAVPFVHVENFDTTGTSVPDTSLGPEDILRLEHDAAGTFWLSRFEPARPHQLKKLALAHEPSELQAALLALVDQLGGERL